jgi:hypothetical protein
MGFPVLRKRIGTAAITSLTLAAASGCAFFEPEEEDLDFEAYQDQLTEMHNEGVRLIEELDAAEARIIQSCLEEQGFTVHPPDEFTSWPPEPRETFMDLSPYYWFLPTAEEAARRGFWQWTTLPGAEAYEDGELYAEFEEHQEALHGAPLSEWMGEELDEFYLLDEEDQYAWYVAFEGEARAAGEHGYLVGLESTATNDDGEAVATYPPPEGCLREMVEAVYGGLGDTDGEDYWDRSMLRPEQPDGDWSAMNERYEERTADAEGDLLDCLADRGRDGWEFYEGNLLVHSYLSESGEGEHPLSSYEDSGTRWPDPPSDAPDADDLEGWLAFERDMAVDFAECGDESGFRAAAEHAWQQAQLRYYLDIEEETYAWQEEMRGYIEQAQEVIGA